MVTTTNDDNQVNLEQVSSLNIEQSRLLQKPANWTLVGPLRHNNEENLGSPSYLLINLATDYSIFFTFVDRVHPHTS